MYYPPYFNSSIDQAAIDNANRWREQDAARLAALYAERMKAAVEYDPQWSQNKTSSFIHGLRE